jgi:hypothetical protein
MSAGTGFDDGYRPADRVAVPLIAEHDHVVRERGRGRIGDAVGAEQMRDLQSHQDADALPGKALQGRVDELLEAYLIPGRYPQVREAVDEDAPRLGPLDGVDEVVDPFVDVDVDGRAVHDFHVWFAQRPAEPRKHSLELSGVLLQGGDHPWLPLACPVHHKVQAHERFT